MGKSKPRAPSQPARVLQIPGKPAASTAAQKLKTVTEEILLEPKVAQVAKRKKAKKKSTESAAESAEKPSEKARKHEKLEKLETPKAVEPKQKEEPKPQSSRPAARVLEIPGRRGSASEKRRFMSDKVAEIRSKPQPPPQKRKAGDTEESAEFKKTLKDVLNFVIPELGTSERRQYERAKIRALGGTLEKRPFEPYAALQRRQKVEEAARQRRLEEEKTLGVSLSAVKQRRGYNADVAVSRKEKALKEKRKRKASDILTLGEGVKERRGMVVLPKNKVRNYA